MLKLQYFGHLMQRADSLKKPWCWERLKAGEEGDRGWDGWMTSTRCTRAWANRRRHWRTGKRGVLRSMGPQRAGRDSVTEQQWRRHRKLGGVGLQGWQPLPPLPVNPTPTPIRPSSHWDSRVPHPPTWSHLAYRINLPILWETAWKMGECET